MCRTRSPEKLGSFRPCNGSASIAYDLPPPAAPPYRTSLSEELKKVVCGPALGLNTTSCASSTSYSGATTCAGIWGVSISAGF